MTNSKKNNNFCLTRKILIDSHAPHTMLLTFTRFQFEHTQECQILQSNHALYIKLTYFACAAGIEKKDFLVCWTAGENLLICDELCRKTFSLQYWQLFSQSTEERTMFNITIMELLDKARIILKLCSS